MTASPPSALSARPSSVDRPDTVRHMVFTALCPLGFQEDPAVTAMVFFDTETTGLNPRNDRLIELVARRYDRNGTCSTFRRLFDPGIEVHPDAERVHGYNRARLIAEGALPETLADWQECIDFCAGGLLVAHNAAFDLDFCNRALRRHKLTSRLQAYDTLAMAQARRPGKRNNLDALCTAYGIDNSRRTLHGADIDTVLLAEVWAAMLAQQPFGGPECAVVEPDIGEPLRLPWDVSLAPWPHPRLVTAMSLGQSLIKPDALAKGDLPGCAVMERSTLSSAMGVGKRPLGERLLLDHDGVRGEIGLLCLSEAGWKSLLRLSAIRPLSLTILAEEFRALRVATDGERGANADGLMLWSGEFPLAWAHAGRGDVAEGVALLSLAAPGHLVVELPRLDGPAPGEAPLIAAARALRLPLAASVDVRLPLPADWDKLRGLGMAVNNGQLPLSRHQWAKPAGLMAALFADLPEALSTTEAIMGRAGGGPLPHAPMLPSFGPPEDEMRQLRAMAEAGLANRAIPAGQEEIYARRLDYEIGVIGGMGFAGYFLVVADFIGWAKQRHIPVGPGRGSGAGSLVAYALTITDIDPLRFDLLFERFLNPDRVSMPDFDIDFCQSRRDEVIDYVRRKYGDDHVAQIATHGDLKARAAIRAAGRQVGMKAEAALSWSRLIPFGASLDQALSDPQGAIWQRLRTAEGAPGRALIRRARELEGYPCVLGVHAAGVVIAGRPITEIAPMNGDTIEFSMKPAEKAGLVKFDFLGLETLTIIQRSCRLAGIDEATIDDSHLDANIFRLLGDGDTVGIFQFESSGMRKYLCQLQPNTIADLVAMNALYRPGPMDNIPRYIDTKQGREAMDCLHPLLEPVLAETYGVPVYQEQVMRMAQVLAGYSLGQADLLRRAMGKKVKEEMDAQRAVFIAGAGRNGIGEPDAEAIFVVMEKFAGYGFNKSHAAAYAVIAWRTAWLKAHHPAAFFAANMSAAINDASRLLVLAEDMRRPSAGRRAVPLLPPDVNVSAADFTLEEIGGTMGVRYALGAIKGLSADALASLITERERNGPFLSLADLALRLHPPKQKGEEKGSIPRTRTSVLLALVDAGAMDSLLSPGPISAACRLTACRLLATYGESGKEAALTGQVTLPPGKVKAVDKRCQTPDITGYDGDTLRAARQEAVLGVRLPWFDQDFRVGRFHDVDAMTVELRARLEAELTQRYPAFSTSLAGDGDWFKGLLPRAALPVEAAEDVEIGDDPDFAEDLALPESASKGWLQGVLASIPVQKMTRAGKPWASAMFSTPGGLYRLGWFGHRATQGAAKLAAGQFVMALGKLRDGFIFVENAAFFEEGALRWTAPAPSGSDYGHRDPSAPPPRTIAAGGLADRFGFQQW